MKTKIRIFGHKNTEKCFYIRKKASIFGSPISLLLSFIVILVFTLIFFTFLNIENTERKLIIEKAGEEVSDNLFLLGLLRSEVSDGGTLSELLAEYQITENDGEIKKDIQEHITKIVNKVYSDKVCWELSINSLPSKKIDENDCTKDLPSDEKIDAAITLPNFNKNTFEVKFETIK